MSTPVAILPLGKQTYRSHFIQSGVEIEISTLITVSIWLFLHLLKTEHNFFLQSNQSQQKAFP